MVNEIIENAKEDLKIFGKKLFKSIEKSDNRKGSVEKIYEGYIKKKPKKSILEKEHNEVSFVTILFTRIDDQNNLTDDELINDIVSTFFVTDQKTEDEIKEKLQNGVEGSVDKFVKEGKELLEKFGTAEPNTKKRKKNDEKLDKYIQKCGENIDPYKEKDHKHKELRNKYLKELAEKLKKSCKLNLTTASAS